MLSGDLLASLASNPLAAAAGLVFVVGAPLAALWAVGRGPMLDLGNPLPRWVRWFLALAILGNWAYLVLAT
jgi:hypothetical protein